MADRYWVGGGSSTNWNATANTNWSATSGGANNASVPTTGDRVIFNAASGSGASVINASVSLIEFDAQAFTGTLTHNTAVTITISAASTTAIRLPLTGTYTAASATALFTITATSGTVDITSNGKRFGALTVNGAGHTTRLLDALRVDTFATSALTLTSGTFNGNTYAVEASQFVCTGATTRVLQLGNGVWTVGRLATGTTCWSLATTGLTFTPGSSTITVASNSLATIRTFAGGGLTTYPELTIDQNSGKGIITFTGANTFAGLTVAGGNLLNLPASTTTTITSAPTLTGTSALAVTLQSSTLGTATTLSCPSGTFSVSWGALRDITGTGGAAFVASNAFDEGGNTGWSITGPYDVATLQTSIDDLPTNAELATALGTADDAVLTQIALVKAKTDNLSFTVTGQVDANVQYVNDVQVTGVGSEADPWGP